MLDKRTKVLSTLTVLATICWVCLCVPVQGQVQVGPRLDPLAATSEAQLVTRTISAVSSEGIISASDMVELPVAKPVETVVTSKPKINAPTKELDFGVLYTGEKWKGTFIIESVGDDELRIQQINKDCGCTSAKASLQLIPPGATAELEVHYSGSAYPTRIDKKVSVLTNDPDTPTTVFKFVGEVTSAFITEPARFPQFGTVSRGQSVERSILIRQIIDEPVKITNVESTSPLVVVRLEEATSERNLPVYRLVASLTVPEDFSERMVKSEIRIHTDFPRQNLMSYTAIAPVEPDLVVNPPFFNFHSVRKGQDPVRQVNIVSKSGKTFNLLKVEHQLADFEIEAVTEEAGLKYKLIAKMKDNFDRKGYFRESITVETDMPGFEKLPVVLYGSLLPAWGAPKSHQVESATPEK